MITRDQAIQILAYIDTLRYSDFKPEDRIFYGMLVDIAKPIADGEVQSAEPMQATAQ